MDLADANAYLSVIKAEEQRRRTSLLWDGHPEAAEAAYEQWLSIDVPFVNELCLVFLVALRHHVERCVLHFAACAELNGQPIKKAEYERRVAELQRPRSHTVDWDTVQKRLKLTGCAQYETVEVLRLLGNAYKHDPSMRPSPALLKHLKLDPNLGYAQIPESGELQQGLASIAGLPEDADYCNIAQRFVERVQEFLQDVQAHNLLSRVLWGKASFKHVGH